MDKILFVTPSFNAGGAERVVLRLLRGLDRSIANYHLVVLWNIGPLRQEMPDDVYFYDLNVRRTRYMFFSLMRLIYSLKPQIIFSSVSRINIGLLALKRFMPKDIKVIIREPSIPSMSLRRQSFYRTYLFGYRKLYSRADMIVCQSRYVMGDLEENFGVDPSKMITVYNPIPIEEIESQIVDSHSPYDSGFNIVTCGRLSYVKGFDILLKAFAILSEKITDSRLTIIGDGPLRNDLERQIVYMNINSRVSLAGFQENPYIYFKHANVFVSSSRWEGLPNAVLEALTCGTPVVATDCPGGTAEIIKDSVNGWLVPPEDPESLAACLISALENANGIRGEPVRSSVKQFSGGVILPKYANLFADVLGACAQ
ncbi:MAG: hypothetical protein C4B58_05140 [Deltaproteobacteria bacterium]|nr:MAG: hypothetical protein C4B58_05140 [Deltaproteobacteria bacterium]